MEASEFHAPAPKISKRLKLLLFLETLLLLLAYFFIIYSYQHMEWQKTEKSIRQMGYSLLTNVQYSANTLDTLTKSPLSNTSYSAGPTLWSYIASPKKISENPAKFEALFIDKYYQLNLLFPDINALFLFTPDGRVLACKYNNTHYYLLQDLKTDTFINPIRKKSGAITFFTEEEIKDLGYDVNGHVLFAGRQLNNIASYKPAAIVIAGLDITDISLSFEKHKLFSSQQFACFDENGKLLFSSDGLCRLRLNDALAGAGDDVYYEILADHEHGLYTVIATDKKDMAGLSSSMKYVFLIFLPVVLLSNLLICIHIIKSVINSYRKMTEKIYVQSLTEKELNLQMLRSQINPHFLYNTLDSMRMTALKGGAQNLALMCGLLAGILRYGVSGTANLVTVAEEYRHLNEYIELIRLRYTNIEICTYIDPSVMDYKIIRLLLQPLVENSVTHGLEDNPSGGVIQIWGYCKKDYLIFTVSDNGAGMSEEHLKLLRGYLNDENTAFKSIGLKNIKKRIQLYYGSSYDLTISSRLYEGTAVTVTLPILSDNEALPERKEQ